ncbi:TPA: flippase [Pseudomonas aeruginosa]
MSLLKNSFTNLLGAAIPALVAMPALGYMARELDAVLFGAAMLIWALVGYAGIFDVGLGKSVVRQIAMSSSKAEKGAIIGSSLLFVFVSGWVACLLVYLFSDYLVLGVFGISASNAEDVLSGVRLSAFCIPLFLMALILQSYLEGVEEFSVFNVYRTISGALSYLAPVLFLYFGGTFFSLICGLLFSRAVSLFIIFLIISSRCPLGLWKWSTFEFRRLINFGGWLAISNLVSPIMVYMDKFVMSSVLGAKSVAFYAAPAELVNRMTIFPVAISRAVFPRLSALGGNDSRQVKRIALICTAALTFPVALLFFMLAPLIVRYWLGEGYVDTAGAVLQILLFGFFFNSLALISYNSLQAAGHSRLTAFIHLFEVVPYLLLLYFAASQWGVLGGGCGLVWANAC